MANQSTLAGARQSARERRPTARAIKSATQNAPTTQRRHRSESDTGSDHDTTEPDTVPTVALTRIELFAIRYKVSEHTNEEVLGAFMLC